MVTSVTIESNHAEGILVRFQIDPWSLAMNNRAHVSCTNKNEKLLLCQSKLLLNKRWYTNYVTLNFDFFDPLTFFVTLFVWVHRKFCKACHSWLDPLFPLEHYIICTWPLTVEVLLEHLTKNLGWGVMPRIRTAAHLLSLVVHILLAIFSSEVIPSLNWRLFFIVILSPKLLELVLLMF